MPSVSSSGTEDEGTTILLSANNYFPVETAKYTRRI